MSVWKGNTITIQVTCIFCAKSEATRIVKRHQRAFYKRAHVQREGNLIVGLWTTMRDTGTEKHGLR
jgi:hypothetical protein